MIDLSKMPSGRFTELTDEDLCGFPVKELSCRGCSGYGNCGFKSYRLYQGTPVSICIQRLDKLKGEAA